MARSLAMAGRGIIGEEHRYSPSNIMLKAPNSASSSTAAPDSARGISRELLSPIPPSSTRNSTKKTSMQGVALTAQDMVNPTEDDADMNHQRSQEVFQQVLRHRNISHGRSVPYVTGYGETLEHQRAACAKKIFNRLRENGIHGPRTFRLMLHHMDLDGDGKCKARAVEGALTYLGIRLKPVYYAELIDLFRTDDEDTVDYAELLSWGCSNWSPQRQEVVKEAYDYLSDLCSGKKLNFHVLVMYFKAEALTTAHVPTLMDSHRHHEFFKEWSDAVRGADGVVTWMDFVDYYLDVSWCFHSDQDFCKFVCSSWGMDMDDWLAKKVFNRYVTNETEQTLPEKDFVRMLDELDPTIKQDEALAWFEAIDEDDSGDVSLQEFLQSKVLKVKRLFDKFDTDESRTADPLEMREILRSLNEAITDEEAEVLYHYADLDGNGEVSFAEFLENHLLKLLQIFDQFNRTGCSRHLNEAEMKNLLKRLDKHLDDYEIHQIYKAIDIDGSGSISFVEFCESHVIRAKALFDRYDIDRSRTLTQFKFKELMLDMDGTLTTAQMDAIYDMVADPNTGKVHLWGFLNPNVVKLKLLFDKYDQDRSMVLDTIEFKTMLKDLFRKSTDADVEILKQAICPPGAEQGITFTMYVRHFKDLNRKYDLMQLAKRREARKKAQIRNANPMLGRH